MTQTIFRRLLEELDLYAVLNQYLLADSKEKIHHFLNQLRLFENPINNKHVLTKNNGIPATQICAAIDSNDELLSFVRQHPLFSQVSKYNDKLMIQRLVEELKMSNLLNEYRILTSHYEIKE
eukprot:340190_1